MKTSFLLWLTGLVAALTGTVNTARAALVPAGFNEPNVVIYGQVTNTLTNPPTAAYYGTLVFNVSPASGSPFTVSAPLQSLANGQFSYKLQIPVEKVPSGFRLDGQTIQTTSTAVNSTLGATVSGAPASLYTSTGAAYNGALAYSEVARGMLVQINIQFNSSATGTNPDSDNNGLDDAWEIQHFGHIGNDPNADPDGDGESNLTEFLDGGDPTCYEWDKFLARYGLQDADAQPAAMPFHDGIPNILQYALGGEPGLTQQAVIAQRSAYSIVTDAGKRYLSLTIQRPAYRTCHVDYLVESSGDLINWKSADNVDVVTLTNQPTLLQVRDNQTLDGGTSPGAVRRFLRLRVNYKP